MDPVLEYVQILKKENAKKVKKEPILMFDPVEATKDEWSNIPRLVAKYVLTLETNLHIVGRYCKEKFAEETTAELRSFLLTEIERIDN